MAVLVTVENEGQTMAGYDGMLATLGAIAKAAPGFILHVSHPVDGGWRVVEIWRSKADADRFFATSVVPHLPPGVHPKRRYQALHAMVRA